MRCVYIDTGIDIMQIIQVEETCQYTLTLYSISGPRCRQSIKQKLLVDATISDSHSKSYLFDSFRGQDDGVVVSHTYAILYPDADSTELLGPALVIWYVDAPVTPR